MLFDGTNIARSNSRSVSRDRGNHLKGHWKQLPMKEIKKLLMFIQAM